MEKSTGSNAGRLKNPCVQPNDIAEGNLVMDFARPVLFHVLVAWLWWNYPSSVSWSLKCSNSCLRTKWNNPHQKENSTMSSIHCMVTKFNICRMGIIPISFIWQDEMRWPKYICGDYFKASHLILHPKCLTSQRSDFVCFISFLFVLTLFCATFFHWLLHGSTILDLTSICCQDIQRRREVAS